MEAAARKLSATPTSEAAEYAREHDQASRNTKRGNNDVAQAGLAADIATYERLRAANPEVERIRGKSGTFKYDTHLLQEYAIAHPTLGIKRTIPVVGGLQQYRRNLLKAMQKHGLGA